MKNDKGHSCFVIRFPSPAADGATRWQIWHSRLRVWCGKIANRLRLPGAVNNIKLDDGVTGQHLEVRVGSLFTVVSVNGRDYYFRRFSGKFDGTGMGCKCN